MNSVKPNNLACPIDGLRLETRNRQLICENGHCYDMARQGYVNLLPVQHKRSKHPGDSKEMVLARTQFLNSGIYQPIAKQLAEIVLSELADTRNACLLDAGCGEGYYLDTILNILKHENVNSTLSFIGLDISKQAIVEATKRNREISWVVGTNRQPPVNSESVDIVICVFGFQSFEGFKKALKPGGKIILIEAGPNHLKELREIIYTEVERSAPPSLSAAEKLGFAMINEQQLTFKTKVSNNDQIHNLLAMTPHLFRATKQGREAAGNLQRLELTVDIAFRILEKTSLAN